MSTRRGFLGGIAGTSTAGFASATIDSGDLTSIKQIASPLADLAIPSMAAVTSSSDSTLGVQGGAIKEFPVAFTQAGIGAIARTPQDKMRDLVSVKDFGAAGDGATDDTAALNLAFSQVGAKVFVPKGVYKVTANLASPACYAIVGDGMGDTIFAPTASVTLFMFLGTYSARLLEGFQIDGAATTGSIGLKFGDDTLKVGTSGGPWSGVVREVTVQNFRGNGGVGVWYADALKSQFDYVRLMGSNINLLAQTIAGSFPTYTSFHRCEFTLAHAKGAVIRTGYSLVFHGCLFESNAAEGLFVDPDHGLPTVGDVVDLILEGGCWFENNYGSSTAQYQLRVAGSTRTARVTLNGGYFGGSASSARAMIFTGTSVRAMVSAPAVPLSVARGIKVVNDGTVYFPTWSPNVSFATVVDFSNASISAFRSGQVQFPTIPTASTDPNTLDDYHEGAFTPAILLGGGSVTYTTRTGRFTKVGRLVTLEIGITISTVTAPSSSLQISGLPFVASPGAVGAISVLALGLEPTATTNLVGRVDAGAATLRLFRPGAGGIVNPGADLKAGSAIYVTATYSV
jgi:hypothetical protein